MDWATRTVLSWRLSNTQDSAFCREALQEAMARYGRPEIFNTDQGSQYTSREFTEVLEQTGVAVSKDGKERWRDNVFHLSATPPREAHTSAAVTRVTSPLKR